MTRITATLHEDLCARMTTSRSFFLRMKCIPNKIFGENQNTILYSLISSR